MKFAGEKRAPLSGGKYLDKVFCTMYPLEIKRTMKNLCAYANKWTYVVISEKPEAFLRAILVKKSFFSCNLSPFTPLIESFGQMCFNLLLKRL